MVLYEVKQQFNDSYEQVVVWVTIHVCHMITLAKHSFKTVAFYLFLLFYVLFFFTCCQNLKKAGTYWCKVPAFFFLAYCHFKKYHHFSEACLYADSYKLQRLQDTGPNWEPMKANLDHHHWLETGSHDCAVSDWVGVRGLGGVWLIRNDDWLKDKNKQIRVTSGHVLSISSVTLRGGSLLYKEHWFFLHGTMVQLVPASAEYTIKNSIQ